MRPMGEISQAILGAAERLVREDDGSRRGPTLQELAHTACVGLQAARSTVQNLCRAGQLEAVAERRVDYRNRPVKEYAPARAEENEERSFWDVASVVQVWARG